MCAGEGPTTRRSIERASAATSGKQSCRNWCFANARPAHTCSDRDLAPVVRPGSTDRPSNRMTGVLADAQSRGQPSIAGVKRRSLTPVRRPVPTDRVSGTNRDFRLRSHAKKPGIAWFGSPWSASGAGGRVFESLYSDQSTAASREVGVFRADRVCTSAGSLSFRGAGQRRGGRGRCAWTSAKRHG